MAFKRCLLYGSTCIYGIDRNNGPHFSYCARCPMVDGSVIWVGNGNANGNGNGDEVGYGDGGIASGPWGVRHVRAIRHAPTLCVSLSIYKIRALWCICSLHKIIIRHKPFIQLNAMSLGPSCKVD